MVVPEVYDVPGTKTGVVDDTLLDDTLSVGAVLLGTVFGTGVAAYAEILKKVEATVAINKVSNVVVPTEKEKIYLFIINVKEAI